MHSPNDDKQSLSNVKLNKASTRGSIFETVLETRHISTSDVSAPNPEIVEPTKYNPNRGYVFLMIRYKYFHNTIFFLYVSSVCWELRNLFQIFCERWSHFPPLRRSVGGSLISIRCARAKNRSGGVGFDKVGIGIS